ncbi:hypothetical protein PWR63_31795 [Paraburkholderia sp. A2WS-5]|uniref:hypothetical protein n=1 Tax=unclassified Paraburkholderia TaxID=2615204 RepID=UPI003B7F91D0
MDGTGVASAIHHPVAPTIISNLQHIAVFVPGGHGVLAGEVKQVLKWATDRDKYVVRLCHGPSCLLSAAIDEVPTTYMFNGYAICVFPDSLDKGANLAIGYMPGPLPWLVGESLLKLGVKVLNKGIDGSCHIDRKLIAGDSPLASQNIGKRPPRPS